MRICKRCGHENKEGVRYCQRCGAALDKAVRTHEPRKGKQPTLPGVYTPTPNPGVTPAGMDAAKVAAAFPQEEPIMDSASKADKDRGFTVPADPCPDGSWFCPDCGAHNAAHARTCNACGRYIR